MDMRIKRKYLYPENEHALYRLLDKDQHVEDLKQVAFDNNIWALKRLEPNPKMKFVNNGKQL